MSLYWTTQENWKKFHGQVFIVSYLLKVVLDDLEWKSFLVSER